MSFLSGSPWQQPGIISGSSGYGQPSNGHQQQQHKPPIALSGASIPTVLSTSSSKLASSPASAQNSDWHCQGQMVTVGAAAATLPGSRITLMEDEAKLGRARTEGTSGMMAGEPASQSFGMSVLKTEDERSRGLKPNEDWHRVEGTLGSAGQSPSSPISSHSSPSSSLPSPFYSPGKLFTTSSLDLKQACSPSFGQNNLEQKKTNNGTETPESQRVSHGQDLLPSLRSELEHGEASTNATSTQKNREDEEKRTSRNLAGNLTETLTTSKPENQILKPSFGKQGVEATPASEPTDSKAGGAPGSSADPASASAGKAPLGSFVDGVEANGLGSRNLSHTGKKGTGLGTVLSNPTKETGFPSQKMSQDFNPSPDWRAGSTVVLNRGIKTAGSGELPQRTAVRRAMSDCSHLSVPMVLTETYPISMGVSQEPVPSTQTFAQMGSACQPRVAYPHVAVRRSLTVTDGTEAGAAMSTMLSSPFMTPKVLPSSPPPKRHHGSCETNVLLPVPAPVGSANCTQDNKMTLTVKSENKEKQEKMDVSNKTAKVDNLDKKEEQQKKDISNDKNQKSDQILKTEEKLEKHDRVSEKAEKVDKPEKTNKDEKKEDEKKPAEKKDEKGGKVPAKSPTGNGGKTLLNLDNKSKPDVGSTKRPSPTTTNKKTPAAKATTPTAAKQPPGASGSNKAAKTPENGGPEKRPSVPKTTPTTRTAANKNGSSVTNKNAANKNDKTENRTGEAKKPKTTARPRPASTAAPATPAASTNGEATHRRRVITKPPVPKQTPLEKKPAGPRPPRTPRPINAPTPDLKNVRSKIGSIDNIKYQPGGGKVSSTPNNKTSESSTPTAKARVQILNRKVDVSKVTSKCGSKDNIKYKPGGGDVKIESHKSNIKAKSKIGSLDNMEAGNGQTNGHKEKTEEKTSPPASGAPATGPAGVTKATPPGGVAKENGMKEPIPSPFGGEGLKETHSLDKRITETK
ncbi:uncharacterized protein map4l isoform X8 [Oryzias latipes]